MHDSKMLQAKAKSDIHKKSVAAGHADVLLWHPDYKENYKERRHKLKQAEVDR